MEGQFRMEMKRKKATDLGLGLGVTAIVKIKKDISNKSYC